MNTLLIGQAEVIDPVMPKVRKMLDNPGVYICGDSANPEATVVLVSDGGRIYSLQPDADLDPARFLPTLMAHGPYRGDVNPDVRTHAATWRANGEPDPHAGHYDAERAALSLGWMTDDEIANGVFMHGDGPLDLKRALAKDPSYHPAIVWLTAAKDRIRWLSRALEKELASPWTDKAAGLPTEPGWYLVMLEPDNDWGLMSDTALQVEFGAYMTKPKAFTFSDAGWHDKEDITDAVVSWAKLPAPPVRKAGA